MRGYWGIPSDGWRNIDPFIIRKSVIGGGYCRGELWSPLFSEARKSLALTSTLFRSKYQPFEPLILPNTRRYGSICYYLLSSLQLSKWKAIRSSDIQSRSKTSLVPHVHSAGFLHIYPVTEALIEQYFDCVTAFVSALYALNIMAFGSTGHIQRML